MSSCSAPTRQAAVALAAATLSAPAAPTPTLPSFPAGTPSALAALFISIHSPSLHPASPAPLSLDDHSSLPPRPSIARNGLASHRSPPGS